MPPSVVFRTYYALLSKKHRQDALENKSNLTTGRSGMSRSAFVLRIATIQA